VLLAQVGISKGHGHGFVAKDLLHFFKTGSTHDKMGREGMTEVMETKIFNTCSSYIFWLWVPIRGPMPQLLAFVPFQTTTLQGIFPAVGNRPKVSPHEVF